METLKITRTERQLGNSTLRVCPLAYGFWRFAGTSVAEATAKVEAALDATERSQDAPAPPASDGGGAAAASIALFLQSSPKWPGLPHTPQR